MRPQPSRTIRFVGLCAVVIIISACVDRFSKKYEYSLIANKDAKAMYNELAWQLGHCSHAFQGGLFSQYSVGGLFSVPGRKSQTQIERPGVFYIHIYHNNSGPVGVIQFFEIEPVGEEKSKITSHTAHKILIEKNRVEAFLNGGKHVCP